MERRWQGAQDLEFEELHFAVDCWRKYSHGFGGLYCLVRCSVGNILLTSDQLPVTAGKSTTFGSATSAMIEVEPGMADEVKNGL